MTNFNYIEQETFSLPERDEWRKLFLQKIREVKHPRSLKDVRLLGMDYDFKNDAFNMACYIGADWVDAKKRQAMVVTPKMRNIDIQSMLMKCFTCDKASERIDEVFYIRTEDKPIEIDAKAFQIEPLLIVYFLNLVSRIIRKGLKSGYVIREECLNSKIKGKILTTLYMKHGMATGRREEVDCRFHEYSIDCVENRIIKRALLFCKQMITRAQKALGIHLSILQNMYASALAAFEKVSDEVSPQELHHLPMNPVFKEYRETLPLAKMIIKKRGYCVAQHHGSNTEEVPPFIINMPELFRRYVCALLNDAHKDSIIVLAGASHNHPDFLKPDERLIITTKYLPSRVDGVGIDDIRNLSAFARNDSIRQRLRVYDDTTVCSCLLIYLSTDGQSAFSPSPLSSADGIKNVDEYIALRMIGVTPPLL